FGQYSKGQCLQRIAGQDGTGLVEGYVSGRAPPAQVIIVHRWQVVMNQGIRMNQFQCAGRGQCGGFFTAYRPGGGQTQGWPDTFAATKNAVTHGCLKSLGNRILPDAAIKFGINALATLVQIGHCQGGAINHQLLSSAEKGRDSRVPSLFWTSCSTRCSADFNALWHSRVNFMPRSNAARDCSSDSSPCSRSRTSFSSSSRDFSKSAMDVVSFAPAMGVLRSGVSGIARIISESPGYRGQLKCRCCSSRDSGPQDCSVSLISPRSDTVSIVVSL